MNALRFIRLSISLPGALLAALLLSGCVEVKLESTFNEDGSALHAFEATIEREGIEQLESFGGEGEVTTTFASDELREQAEAAGFDFEAIDTDDKVGSRVTQTFEDGGQVGTIFDEILVASAEEGAASPAGAVTGEMVQDGDEYRLNLTVNSDILFANTGVTEDPEAVEDLGFGDLDSFITITYTAFMPGEITETNGLDLGDGKVEWELPLTGTTEISAVSEESSGGGSGGWIVIGGLIALLVVGGLAGIYLFTRRRTPAPYSAGPGAETFNTPPNSQPTGTSFNTAPNLAPEGATTNMATSAPPSQSMGFNAPPLARTDDPGDRPTHEQDTTRLP